MNKADRAAFHEEFVKPFLKGGKYEILGRALVKKWHQPATISIEDCAKTRSRQNQWVMLNPDLYFKQAKHQIKITVKPTEDESFPSEFIDGGFESFDSAISFSRLIVDAITKSIKKEELDE